MNAVWHIVRKDFRHLAGPLALWLALVLAHAGLLFIWQGDPGANPTIIEGKRFFVNICGVMVGLVGFILAAWLVMEDSLVSTQAFWRTRAISGARLLAAKAAGALLMFGVLPAMVLGPVWVACGFSAREITFAALEWGLIQAGCSLGAFALASLTGTSGQFIARLLAGALALPWYLLYVLGAFEPGFHLGRSGFETSRILLVLAGVALILLAVVVHQFLSRRASRSWLICLGGFGVLAAGPWWHRGLGGNIRLETSPPPLVFTAERLSADATPHDGPARRLRLEGRVDGVPADAQVQVDSVIATWTQDGAPTPGASHTFRAPDERGRAGMILHLAGLPEPADSAASWTVVGEEANEAFDRAPEGKMKVQGSVAATLFSDGTRLGELPLQIGAVLREGSSVTRVKDLNWVEGNLEVLIEERDAWTFLDGGFDQTSANPAGGRIRPKEDRFVIRNRDGGMGLVAGVREIGTVRADSIVVGRRILVVPPSGAGTSDWLEHAVLVKVRFSPGQKFILPLGGEPLASVH
jgi:hypothetical protein